MKEVFTRSSNAGDVDLLFTMYFASPLEPLGIIRGKIYIHLDASCHAVTHRMGTWRAIRDHENPRGLLRCVCILISAKLADAHKSQKGGARLEEPALYRTVYKDIVSLCRHVSDAFVEEKARIAR